MKYRVPGPVRQGGERWIVVVRVGFDFPNFSLDNSNEAAKMSISALRDSNVDMLIF